MKKTTTFLVLAATTLVLTACGSGTDTAATPVVAVAAPQSSTTAPASSAAAPARTAPVSDPGADVDADDQSGDGTTVVVRDARITVGPGWLAVRTDDDDRGRLLGSAAVAPGQTGPVTVTLTEPVPAAGDDDDDLTVVLHADDGDGVFDERLDPRVLDDDDDDQDDDDIEDDDFDYRLN